MHLIWVFLFALLAGCGFQLRGMTDLPPWLDNVAIVIENAHRDLEPRLKKQLQAYHISVCNSLSYARYLLVIESENFQQQVTNVAASTAPRQYQLIYSVRFKLIDAKGGLLLPPNRVLVTRYLTVNSDRILGSDFEENQFKNEMRDDIAMQIINRLGRARPSIY